MNLAWYGLPENFPLVMGLSVWYFKSSLRRGVSKWF